MRGGGASESAHPAHPRHFGPLAGVQSLSFFSCSFPVLTRPVSPLEALLQPQLPPRNHVWKLQPSGPCLTPVNPSGTDNRRRGNCELALSGTILRGGGVGCLVTLQAHAPGAHLLKLGTVRPQGSSEPLQG